MLQALGQLLGQAQAALTAQLAGLPVLVKQRLQLLQLLVQARPAQGGSEVIEDYRLGAPLGLAALPRIIDDEGIEMGQRT